MAQHSLLSCLLCRAPLEAILDSASTEISCPECGKRFPCTPFGMPILVRDPELHLTSTYHTIDSFLRSEEARLDKVERALADGQKRLPALRRIASGMAQNLDLYRRWLKLIEQTPIAAERLVLRPAETAGDNTGYTSILRYLFQDWSGSHESEAVIARIRDCVAQDLHDHLRDPLHEPDPIVVIGAGTGRIAHEVQRPSVWALDLSLPMALTYGLLRREALHVCEPTESNAYTIADLYREHHLRAAVTRDLAGYLIADALHMPFLDRSLGAVLSIYFSDVVPLSALLREVTRVLRPGGALLHFGPLGYSFYQPDELWTIEEVRGLLSEHGFRLRAERFVPHLLGASPHRLSQLHVNAWSFIATYEP